MIELLMKSAHVSRLFLLPCQEHTDNVCHTSSKSVIVQ